MKVEFFLSLRIFGLLPSLIYSQRFGRCVLRLSWSVSYQTRESKQNFKMNPLFNPWDKVKSKLATLVEGDPKAPFSIATKTEMYGRALLLSLDCSILPLILTLYYWMLSKATSSTIFWVFGMTWPGIEPRSPRPWVNILLMRQMTWLDCSNFVNYDQQQVLCNVIYSWHINQCRLCNAKSCFYIYIKYIWFV